MKEALLSFTLSLKMSRPPLPSLNCSFCAKLGKSESAHTSIFFHLARERKLCCSLGFPEINFYSPGGLFYNLLQH